MSVKSRSALKESGPFLDKDVVRFYYCAWRSVALIKKDKDFQKSLSLMHFQNFLDDLDTKLFIHFCDNIFPRFRKSMIALSAHIG